MSKAAPRIKIPNGIIAKYARDKHGNPVGLVVAKRVGEAIGIGWAYKHKEDKYDRNRAWLTALGRAATSTNAKMPAKLAEIHNEIRIRAERYFRVGQDRIVG